MPTCALVLWTRHDKIVEIETDTANSKKDRAGQGKLLDELACIEVE